MENVIESAPRITGEEFSRVALAPEAAGQMSRTGVPAVGSLAGL